MKASVVYGPALFFIIGIGLMGAAVYFALATQSFLATAVTAEGTVLALERSRSGDSNSLRPRVAFTDAEGNRREFVSSVGSSFANFQRGDAVRVFYQPDDPERARIDSFLHLWFLPLLLGGMGLVFSSLGGGILTFQMLGRRRATWLREQGERVEAKFQGVSRNLSLQVNGRHPFRIACQWQDPADGRVHVFLSENIWYDPTEFLASDQPIPVWIEPGNPKKHLVDTSFLPPMG